MTYHSTAIFKFKLLTLLVMVVSLNGCAFHQWQVNQVSDDLAVGNVDAAVARLQSIHVPQRDQAQMALNLGMLKHYQGEFTESNHQLDIASQIIESYRATSIIENIGAATVNETLRTFIGSTEEQVMIHFIAVLNYLSSQDLSAARVEALQADVLMKTLGEHAQIPAMHIITGVVYQLLAEWDNALISYRNALKLLDEQQQPIPHVLKQALLALTASRGLDNEHSTYLQRFAGVTYSADASFVVLLDGVVEAKKQDKTVVYDPVSNAHHSISVPYYANHTLAPHTRTYPINNDDVPMSLIMDVNAYARDALAREIPSITAFALARVVARYQAVKKAREEQNHLLAFTLNVSGVATEVADVRSWNTLPGAIYLGWEQIPANANNDVPRAVMVNNLNGEIHAFD